MSTASVENQLQPAHRMLRSHAVVLAVFTATLFLSAFLLFSVQPVFAKMVLPKLGGSPSVWAVSLCFFQAVLLAGYSYAYALNRFATPVQAPLVHLALLVAASLALPFGLPAGTEPTGGDTYLWLIGVLALGVGMPFFAVSANAPLLQAWYANTGHPHARDPYFLYGASNLGSLLALLAYPVVIEPMLGLATQAALWTAGFVLLAAMIAASGLLMLRESRVATATSHGVTASTADGRPVSNRERAAWVLYAFVPSGLLVAFTTFITTDIASAPFLWVTPLAAFLLTFVLVFRDTPLVPMRLLDAAHPLLAAMALLAMIALSLNGWAMLALVHAPLFLVTTLVCHKQLYDARPATRHLTQFYLWMSLGGVLGGVFAAVIAPQLFNGIHEYMLLIVLGLMARPGMAAALANRAEVAAAAKFAGISALTVLALALLAPFAGSMASAFIFIVLLALAAFMANDRRRPLRLATHAAAMAFAIVLLPSSFNAGYSERSFFGVSRVTQSVDGKLRLLMHGTTIHGAQLTSDIEQAAKDATARPRPLTYYYAGSPMQMGVEAARLATGKTAGGLVVGGVGLGAGSLACAAKPGEDWRFYEIDPVVIKIARDPAQFTFLSRCLPGVDIVPGDARLTIASEPADTFDYLVIDAFSSDAVPVHMLTREAMQSFLARTAPQGLLAMHVTNRYMDLVGVATATALSIPGAHVAIVSGEPASNGPETSRNKVMFVARDAKSRRFSRWITQSW
ncbi:MAG: fused MFS/spermidine synthase [Hyphomicrobiaceae bacterium]